MVASVDAATLQSKLTVPVAVKKELRFLQELIEVEVCTFEVEPHFELDRLTVSLDFLK